MGSDANKLTDEAMGAIRDQLGQKFTDLSARNTLTDTPTLLQGLINIQNQSIPNCPTTSKGQFKRTSTTSSARLIQRPELSPVAFTACWILNSGRHCAKAEPWARGRRSQGRPTLRNG